MSRESKLAKNTLIISIGTFLPKLASFITLPILTGCLTKEEYGTYDLITVLVSLLLPTVTLQIQVAAFRFLIDCRDDEKRISSIVTNILAFIVPTSLTAVVVLFFVMFKIDVWVRLFICLYFAADIFVNAARQIARGLDKNMSYSLSAIFSAAGKIIFTLVCVYYLRMGLLGTTIALFAASTFSLIYLLLRARLFRFVDPRSFDRQLLVEMLKYSWPMIPNSLSNWVMRVSDRFVVTAVMGVSANAIYAVANKLPSLLYIAQNTFTLAWQENASLVSKDKDASEYYSLMFRTMYDLMAGSLGLLIAATPILFKILIRGDYGEAYFQMPILFLGMFFFSMSTYLGGIYVAYMKSRSVGLTTTVAAIVNLVTDIASIKWIGLYAASGSTLVAYIFLFVYRAIDVQKIIRVKIGIMHCSLVLAVMILESVLCYMQRTVLDVINLIVGICVFLVLNKSFVRAVLKKARKMIKRRVG